MTEVPSVSLDLHTGQLTYGTRTFMLRPKTLAVLRHLLDHARHFVSAADLRAAVWPGIVVSDGVLRNCIHELRVALDDERETPQFIETLPHKGYRWIGAVVRREEGARGWGLGASSPSPQASSLKPQAPNLVGRETELAQLHHWLDKARSGQRQLVFIAGEPGIGKTTLVEAFRRSGYRGRGAKENTSGPTDP